MSHLAGSTLYAAAAPRAIRAMVDVVVVNFGLAWEFGVRQGVSRRGLLFCLNELFSRTLTRRCNRQHGTISELSTNIPKRLRTTTPTRNGTV